MKINKWQMEIIDDNFDKITRLLEKSQRNNMIDVFWREMTPVETIDHFICSVDDISQFLYNEWGDEFKGKNVFMRKNGYVYKVELNEKDEDDNNDLLQQSYYNAGYSDGLRAALRNN